MKRILVLIFVSFVLGGCCSYKNAPIVWYWNNELYESLGGYKEYAIYDFYSPFIGTMDKEESIPAHYQILLPPKKEIVRILYGPYENRCFFYTRKRGIGIFQDLRNWERKYDNGLKEISKELAEDQLSKFAEQFGKEIKLKEKKHHYMYVDQEIRIVMFNLSEDDYQQFVAFPLENLKIRRRGEHRKK